MFAFSGRRPGDKGEDTEQTVDKEGYIKIIFLSFFSVQGSSKVLVKVER